MKGLWRVAGAPRAVLGRRIGRELRERIILHVSAVNDCAVCTAAHTALGHVAGISEGPLGCERQPPLPNDPRIRTALRYAELRTRGLDHEDREVTHQLEQLFDPEERREIRAIVDAFTFANRFNNSWEPWLPGAETRRRWLGLRAPLEDDDSDPSAGRE